VTVLSAAVLVALLLAGCGGDSGGTVLTDPTTSSPTLTGRDGSDGDAGGDSSLTSVARPTAIRPPVPTRLAGTGNLTRRVTASTDGPFVMSAAHQGQGVFRIRAFPAGETAPDAAVDLVDARGPIAGRWVWDGVRGSDRFQVTAAGPWELRFMSPSEIGAAPLPATMSGDGPDVSVIRVDADRSTEVTGSHSGEGRFWVYLQGFGDAAGWALLFNERGAVDEARRPMRLPRGSYLVAVDADGPWTIRFGD